MAQWGAVLSVIIALGGAALLSSVHKIDEGHTGVYYRWHTLFSVFQCLTGNLRHTCASEGDED